MNINWNNIATIDGQREGFEELVCQLAGQEPVPDRKKFVRIGKPDGGKECFWELADSSIHCWQAKYFVHSLRSSEWTQVDESVKSAIHNHPNLMKYYIAIPVDRPDGKARGKSMLQKWNEYVWKWEAYAESKGMNVTFEYWGKHELETRLRKRENEGLLYYFFNREEFSDLWFERKNQESIDSLGGRYSPDLNFELPFSRSFDGLERGERFIAQIDEQYDKLLEKYWKIRLKVKNEDIQSQQKILEESIEVFRIKFESFELTGVAIIAFESLEHDLLTIRGISRKIQEQLWKLRSKIEKAKEKKGEKVDYYSRPYQNELHYIGEFIYGLDIFSNFIHSAVCRLANKPILILAGPAGKGKSHTLADIVKEREGRGLTSLLLLGENFLTNEQPWTQILRNQLRFNQNEEVFLGALNAKAENQQSRILIIVDALNEGNGRLVWPKRLRAFIRTFERFSWLGLVLSIRAPFDRLIAPSSAIDEAIATRLNHPGFEGVEYKASSYFFRYYGITPPSSPLLHPEFQNPLFLKLFCEGLAKRGLSEIPEGYEGISMVIKYFLESIELKLSQPDELDYDVKLCLMQKSIDGILVKMLESSSDHVSYNEGDQIVNSYFQGKCGSKDTQYLKRLISENLLNENLYWNKKGDHYYGVHFAYQRFQDHLVISALLDKYLDESDPTKSFENGILRQILENDNGEYFEQNLIEALSIQVPERTCKELHEVAPYAAKKYPTAYAFIDGLIWRRSDTLGESSLAYVNNVLSKDDDLFFSFIDSCISVAIRPNFYFNADWIHSILFDIPLAERDSWWTTWLQNKYGENSGFNSVKRLIDWAWDESIDKHLNDETARLASVLLTWFLTSSNRYLRDGASNALVCVLQDRTQTLIQVLRQFEGVNDPYICERLYAVAYGCALRTEDRVGILELSKYVYEQIFDVEEVYPHILLRDYARGIIEYALHLKLDLEVDEQKFKPPYKSSLPESTPTNEEIDEKYVPKNGEGNYGGNKWGTTAILRSMTTEYGRGVGGYGDFGRYVFQSAFRNWNVNYDKLSNLAIQRIFELGYNPEVFTEFDSHQGSGRGSGHLERIGRKYQWIVFYELLAIVADNFDMPDKSDWDRNRLMKYDGPWMPYVRDYDPTITIRKTQEDQTIDNANPPWWFPLKYNNWQSDYETWMRNEDFPKIKDYLVIKDRFDVEWINLDMHPDWVEPKKRGEDDRGRNKRRIWSDVGSMLIKPRQLNKMLNVDASESEQIWWSWIPSVKLIMI